MADEPSAYGDLPYVMSGLQRRRNPYDARRQMAMSMVQGGMDFSPVQHPLQGASRLAQALVGTLMMRNADSQEAEADRVRQEAIGKASGLADPQERLAAFAKIDPEIGMRYGAQMAMQEAKAKRDAEEARQSAAAFGGSYGMGGGGMGGPADAIASIESGGRYDAMGPQVPGQGQAHGKYQVMPANIGPWTKEVLGQELTPAQFLASPQAQDAVFQAKFGQYVQKYGPQGAARAWFAGEGGMNNPNARDINGTTVAGYERKFVQNGGAGPQLAQGDNVLPVPRPVADGSGTPLAPQMPQRPIDVPKPAPDPALIRELQQQVANKVITPADAAKRVNDDIIRRWEYAQKDATEGRRQQDAIAAEDRRAEAAAARVGPEALLRGTAENYIKNVRPKAENAVQDIAGIHQIRQLLDAGAFTGVGAEAKTYLAKLGEFVGMSPSETAGNTQVLGAQLANRVLAGMGGSLGSGFSNADRDFVEKAKGGQIAMTETALRRLMDIGERQAKMTLDAHGREVERFKRMPEMGRMTGSGYFDLPPVQSYQEWAKANPLAAANPQQVGQPQGQQAAPPVPGARQAPDGNFYVPDPNRPGKYLMVR